MKTNPEAEAPESFIQQSDLIPVNQARVHYDIGINSANAKCRSGEWPATKISGRWFVYKSGLIRWEKQLLTGAANFEAGR